jgi:hypothetical protein
MYMHAQLPPAQLLPQNQHYLIQISGWEVPSLATGVTHAPLNFFSCVSAWLNVSLK